MRLPRNFFLGAARKLGPGRSNAFRTLKLFSLLEFIALLALVFASLETAGFADEIVAEDPSPATTPALHEKLAEQSSGTKTLTEFGQSYVLNSSQRSESLNTEEYVLQGETAENWSQAIVYQRILFATPAAPDSLVGSIKKRLEESAADAQLRLILQGRNASIFAVHYAKSAHHSEQVAIALAAVADPKRPNELHVIQFALRPERLDLATMESMVKRWQARFQSQATSLNR